MSYFAVIDTETNWRDQVMSIGTVIADADSFRPIDAKYHVLTPEYLVGGMYSNTLFADSRLQPAMVSRQECLSELANWFYTYGVRAIYAYNATFDRNHLPELRTFDWYDIMRLAAYRQYNRCIPPTAECCSTGRLKRGFGVEPMLQLLSHNRSYHETHNALYDAMDELEIMRLLGYHPTDYILL